MRFIFWFCDKLYCSVYQNQYQMIRTDQLLLIEVFGVKIVTQFIALVNYVFRKIPGISILCTRFKLFVYKVMRYNKNAYIQLALHLWLFNFLFMTDWLFEKQNKNEPCYLEEYFLSSLLLLLLYSALTKER